MIRRLAQKIAVTWDEFFFTPISPATIGLFRICFGIVVFLSVLGKYPHREIFYGGDAIVSSATTGHHFPKPEWIYFRWVPDGDPALAIYFQVILAATICLIFGLCTRVSSILVFIGLISLSNRNFFIDNSGDDLMRINSFFLMFTQAGAAYSIDRWIRVRRGKEGPELTPRAPWAQRLLQLQVAYLYLDTFILKLPGEGWMDGTALYYALRYLELRRFDFHYMFYYLWQIKLATWSVMAGEFSLAILIWVRPLRYYLIFIGIMLHTGINLTMQFPVFQYVMIASLINFIYPEDIERVFTKIGQRLSRGSSIRTL
jgi:hypothetical protein